MFLQRPSKLHVLADSFMSLSARHTLQECGDMSIYRKIMLVSTVSLTIIVYHHLRRQKLGYSFQKMSHRCFNMNMDIQYLWNLTLFGPVALSEWCLMSGFCVNDSKSMNVCPKLFNSFLDVGWQLWMSHTKQCDIRLCLLFRDSGLKLRSLRLQNQAATRRWKAFFSAILLAQSVRRENSNGDGLENTCGDCERALHTEVRHRHTCNSRQSIQSW